MHFRESIDKITRHRVSDFFTLWRNMLPGVKKGLTDKSHYGIILAMPKWIVKIELGKSSLRVTIPKAVVALYSLEDYKFAIIEDTQDGILTIRGFSVDGIAKAIKEASTPEPDRSA